MYLSTKNMYCSGLVVSWSLVKKNGETLSLVKLMVARKLQPLVPTCKKCVKSLFLNLCGKTDSQWFSSSFLRKKSNWTLISLYFNFDIVLLLKVISKLRKHLVVPSFTLDIFSSFRHEIDKSLVSRLKLN